MASIDDGLFSIAKGAAYSALLSFFPVLTSAATIFVQVRADYVQQNMAEFLSEILPPGTEEVVMEQFRSRGQHHLVAEENWLGDDGDERIAVMGDAGGHATDEREANLRARLDLIGLRVDRRGENQCERHHGAKTDETLHFVLRGPA